MEATVLEPVVQETQHSSANAAVKSEPTPSAPSISADDFQALEARVLRAVEIVRREREARAVAEAQATQLAEQSIQLKDKTTKLEQEVATLKAQIATFEAERAAEHDSLHTELETQIHTLNQERDTVRLRVEKMLQQMDELL